MGRADLRLADPRGRKTLFAPFRKLLLDLRDTASVQCLSTIELK